MKNKYFDGSHISERKFQQIVRLFCLDIEAKKAAELTGVSRQSINKIFAAIRLRIFDISMANPTPCYGEFELDESYFGARRKIIVFGILKRNRKVSAYMVENCSEKTLLPIIKEHITVDSVIHTDGFKTYSRLSDSGFKNHFIVNHGNNEFAKQNGIHINGIENFWGLCKSRLSKFRGINKNTFYLHLKECEFRYNNKNKNIYKLLINSFSNFPLKLS